MSPDNELKRLAGAEILSAQESHCLLNAATCITQHQHEYATEQELLTHLEDIASRYEQRACGTDLAPLKDFYASVHRIVDRAINEINKCNHVGLIDGVMQDQYQRIQVLSKSANHLKSVLVEMKQLNPNKTIMRDWLNDARCAKHTKRSEAQMIIKAAKKMGIVL